MKLPFLHAIAVITFVGMVVCVLAAWSMLMETIGEFVRAVWHR
jgi:hypothetical protein